MRGKMPEKKKREDKVQTKKDTGIAKIDAPMSNGSTVSFPMEEAVRDALNKTRGRPRPPAFDANKATTQELENMKYSGYRINHFTNEMELWIVGKVAVRKNATVVANNPGLLAAMHEEAFATVGSIISIDANEIKREKDIEH